jgi:hypothetical protein
MSIFNLHSTVLGDYRDFVRSFFTVADDRAREFVDRELVEQARLLLEALLQQSPSYACVASVDALAVGHVLLDETAPIFRIERGDPAGGRRTFAPASAPNPYRRFHPVGRSHRRNT